MKKNYMMRLAAVLLVLVLLSTCVISGTFAKFTTAGDAEDSARVAKWGVSVEVKSDAFGATYEKDDSQTAITNTVVASEDAVAPGTDGTLATIKLTGAPEVAVKVTYTATLTLTGWTVDGDEYCPLVFKVGDDEYQRAAGETVAQFAARVEEAIEAYSKEYAPSQDLSDVDGQEISWAWAFSTNAENDKLDTKLGNAAAAGNGAEIYFKLEVTVEQID